MINKILIRLNIKPFKVVSLKTGIRVEHYRNGKLKTI